MEEILQREIVDETDRFSELAHTQHTAMSLHTTHTHTTSSSHTPPPHHTPHLLITHPTSPPCYTHTQHITAPSHTHTHHTLTLPPHTHHISPPTHPHPVDNRTLKPRERKHVEIGDFVDPSPSDTPILSSQQQLAIYQFLSTGEYGYI